MEKQHGGRKPLRIVEPYDVKWEESVFEDLEYRFVEPYIEYRIPYMESYLVCKASSGRLRDPKKGPLTLGERRDLRNREHQALEFLREEIFRFFRAGGSKLRTRRQLTSNPHPKSGELLLDREGSIF